MRLLMSVGSDDLRHFAMNGSMLLIMAQVDDAPGELVQDVVERCWAHIERARRRNGGLPLRAHGGRADEAVGSPAP